MSMMPTLAIEIGVKEERLIKKKTSLAPLNNFISIPDIYNRNMSILNGVGFNKKSQGWPPNVYPG